MKNDNYLEKNNMFSKIKSWVYNLFHKSSVSAENIETIEEAENIEVKNIEIKPKTAVEEYREKMERRQYLLNLQRMYKNGEILEENMSEEDRTDLENLYIEQNTELKRKIRSLNNKIAKYNK